MTQGEQFETLEEFLARALAAPRHPVPLPWDCANEALGGQGLHPGLHLMVSEESGASACWGLQIAAHAASRGVASHFITYRDGPRTLLRKLRQLMKREGISEEDAMKLPLRVAAEDSSWAIGAMAEEAGKRRESMEPESSLLFVVDSFEEARPSLDCSADAAWFAPNKGRAAVQEALNVARTHNAVVIYCADVMRSALPTIQRLRKEDKLGKGDPGELIGLVAYGERAEAAACTIHVGCERSNLALAKNRNGPGAWVNVDYDHWRDDKWLREYKISEHKRVKFKHYNDGGIEA